MAEYIDKQKAIEIASGYCHPANIAAELAKLPAADVVSRGAYDQTDWERCVAMTQLKEIDKSLGERMDDVRPVVLCRDCVHYEMGVCLKIYDDGAANKDAWQERKPDDFCSYGEKREES